MKNFLFVFFSLFFSLCLKAQNLVPNYSFEILRTCPVGSTNEFDKAMPWFKATAGTPDIFNICGSNMFTTVPMNYFGNQNPRTGNGYSGFYTKVGANYREYLEVKLNKNMLVNKKYCIELYISMSDTEQLATSSIGAYLSKDSLLKDTVNYNSPLNTYTPQIQNPPSNFITDKVNWVPISGIYTAQGGERFITIGNFNDDANTPIQVVSTGTEPWSYYYIDDVSVVELPEASELTGGDKVLCTGDSILLGAAQKLNVSYTWEGSGIVGSSGGSLAWVKPNVTTTYTLTVSDTSVVCANSSTAVVTVTVKQEVSLDAGRDTVVCDSKPVLLGTVAQPNCRYIWKPSTWLNDSTLAQPTTSPYGSITYYLSVSDTSFGVACTALKDSVKIYLKQDCPFPAPGKNSFYIPTAFSPNGDNNNDVLYVYGKNIEKIEFTVYNRWGEKVFEQNCSPSPNYELPAPNCIGWNGRYKNENAEEGVYVWYAKAKFKDSEEKTYKGTVMLVR